MAAQPRRTNGRKALRLPYWKAEGVSGRKLELNQYFSEHGVDISLLNETHLESYQALWFGNHIYQWTNFPTPGVGTGFLFRKGIDNYAVPVLSLQHLEATVMHLVLANRPVKLLAAYLSPT
jgi:hypothetical protein